jgi:hypothetical protein
MLSDRLYSPFVSLISPPVTGSDCMTAVLLMISSFVPVHTKDAFAFTASGALLAAMHIALDSTSVGISSDAMQPGPTRRQHHRQNRIHPFQRADGVGNVQISCCEP